jgi:SNF2 family DNA or RNA helicase
LDLLSGHLSKNDFPFVQLDGSMGFAARQVALKEFCENDDMTLLMTLGTGVVGYYL